VFYNKSRILRQGDFSRTGFSLSGFRPVTFQYLDLERALELMERKWYWHRRKSKEDRLKPVLLKTYEYFDE
jgi:hypothetical protein